MLTRKWTEFVFLESLPCPKNYNYVRRWYITHMGPNYVGSVDLHRNDWITPFYQLELLFLSKKIKKTWAIRATDKLMTLLWKCLKIFITSTGCFILFFVFFFFFKNWRWYLCTCSINSTIICKAIADDFHAKLNSVSLWKFSDYYVKNKSSWNSLRENILATHKDCLIYHSSLFSTTI